MLRKVISGGQVGVDIAALRAAKRVGLETGGAMPKGFKAKDGLHPEYAQVYNMTEHHAVQYKHRTLANVRDSDATLLITKVHYSPGTLCTINAAKLLGRSYFQLRFETMILQPEEAIARVLDGFPGSVETLNVAGNSLTELEPPVFFFLVVLFARFGERNNV